MNTNHPPTCSLLAGLLLGSFALSTAQAGTYTNNFNNFDPNILTGAALYGSAIDTPYDFSTGGVDDSGVLKLTTPTGNQQSSFIVSDLDNGSPVGGFIAQFKLLIDGGSARPADGFSFCFGSDVAESPFGEEGSGTGITICFDTWDNNGDDTAPAIDVKVGGTIIATAYSAGQREGGRARPAPILKTPSGQDFDLRTGPQFADVRIEWRDGLLTLNYKGFDVFKSLPVFLDPISGGKFGMGARTGGANDNHWVDNLGLQTLPPSSAPAITSFEGTPLGVSIRITDAGTQVNQNSIQLKFDGSAVTPQITKSGSVTTIQYTTAAVLASGSTHTATLTFADSAGVSKTIDFSYAVPPYIALPSDFATAAGAVDKTKPGFRIRPYVTEENNPNSLAWTEEQLAGLRGPNLADLSGADASGFYVRDSVVNFDIGGGAGNFQPDDQFPGLPGSGSRDGGTGNSAMEILTFLDFPQAGSYTMGVNSDDGFRVSSAKNLQDPYGLVLGQFDGGRGAADSIFTVLVEKPGIYPIRLIWQNGGGGANLEWFTVNAGTKVLINSSAAGAINAYRQGPAGPPILKSIRPADKASGVLVTSSVEVKLSDADTQVAPNTIRLTFDGQVVTPTVTKAGAITTVTYDPPGNLGSSSEHMVTIEFGDNATPPNTKTLSWSFLTERVPITLGSFLQSAAGLVAMEAENFHALTPQGDHTWAFSRIAGGYSGEGYLESAPNSGVNQSSYPDLLDQSPRLDYNVNFTKSGRHYLWVRGNALSGSDDSLHGGIDGDNPEGARRVDNSFSPNNAWVWVGRINGTNPDTGDNRATIDVPTTGEHTVNIWMREDGTKIDKIIVTSDAAFTPVGAGPDESRHVGQAPPPTVTITAPSDKATFTANATVTIQATASDTDGTIAKVEFLANGMKIGEDTTSPFEFVWNNVPTGRYTLTAKATDNTADFATSAPVKIVVGTPPDVILFVAGTIPPNGSDQQIIDRLKGFGFDVKIVEDVASQTSDADDTVLIVTSSTCNSGDVLDKYRNAPLPVVNWEQALQDNYLMTGDVGDQDRGGLGSQTTIEIVRAGHGLAGGLSPGVKTVVSSATTFTWGVPNANATVVATLTDGSGHPCIYVYEKGATLIDDTTKAPEKRIHIFLENNTYAVLTADGKKLVDAAFSYALGRDLSEPLKFNVPTVQGGNVSISWTGAGTLEEAAAVNGPWSNSANQANPQTISATGTKFYRLKR